MVKIKKNTMKYFLIVIAVLFTSCDKLFPDEKLTMQRTDYIGDELRIDGYYYIQDIRYGYTNIMFLYKNGVMLQPNVYLSLNLDTIEKKINSQGNEIGKEKAYWGVFLVNGHQLKYEQWIAPNEGGLSVAQGTGSIENDTTFCIIQTYYSYNNTTMYSNKIYHFRQFSPKPDSTNNFIP
jgi:hypothetical protein